MNEALYIFDVTLASEDNGKTNVVFEYKCEAENFIEAMEACLDYCKAVGYNVVNIEENFEKEFNY